jgi:predicted metal-dependent HD superfamily phosphohydrolase
MSLNHTEKEISQYIFKLFKEELKPDFVYHNFAHSQKTVDTVKKLSEEYNLTDDDKENLVFAAWFHDTGYIKDPKNHEEESIKIAKKYLGSDFPKERMDKIANLIISTKVGNPQQTINEEIIHDADYVNMGKKKFEERAELLRCEWEKINFKTYTDLEWAESQLNFLIEKRFKTSAALNEYGSTRERNIKKQRDLVEKIKNDQYKLQLKEKSTNAKLDKEGRGIETLYRSVYSYHMELSSMADSKANIMISINTIVVSVIITLFGSGFTFGDSEGFRHVRYVIPMLLLVVSSLISVTFAILSAKPNINNKQKFELENKNSSVLFFGNFAQLKLDEFVAHIKELKQEKNELYESMTVDIYHLGGVLIKKYKLLTWSYNIFMIGLILCAVGFLGITIYSY